MNPNPNPDLVAQLANAMTAQVQTDAGIDALAEKLAELLTERLRAPLAADMVARLRVDTLAGDDLILSRVEAARFLGRSPKTLELWASQGKGPVVTQLGPRAIGYRIGNLRAYARDNAIAAGIISGSITAAA